MLARLSKKSKNGHPPTAGDNCPRVTAACSPPSGSTFTPGTTTVSRTATGASAGIGFLRSGALGFEFFGNLFVGFSEAEPLGGPLFRFKLTGDGRMIAVDDSRLQDRVADNSESHDITESESLLIGTGFGIITDIKTRPNGNLFVVSLDKGSIFEIHRK
jgi:hypothetical protein